jgi:hypothetical protein
MNAEAYPQYHHQRVMCKYILYLHGSLPPLYIARPILRVRFGT